MYRSILKHFKRLGKNRSQRPEPERRHFVGQSLSRLSTIVETVLNCSQIQSAVIAIGVNVNKFRIKKMVLNDLFLSL
jgi:hypothetical protein